MKYIILFSILLILSLIFIVYHDKYNKNDISFNLYDINNRLINNKDWD